MKCFLLSVCATAAVFCCSCSGDYFEMPRAGATAAYEIVDADMHGNFYIKPECSEKGIAYHGFCVDRVEGSPLRAYISENTTETATWRINPAEFRGNTLVCTARRLHVPPQIMHKINGPEGIAEFAKSKYEHDPQTVHFSVNPSERNGIDSVDYVLKIRLRSGRFIVSRGFMMYMPEEPGVILDANYVQAEGSDLWLELAQYGDDFLKAVHILEKK